MVQEREGKSERKLLQCRTTCCGSLKTEIFHEYIKTLCGCVSLLVSVQMCSGKKTKQNKKTLQQCGEGDINNEGLTITLQR